jgi:hypothetical protein
MTSFPIGVSGWQQPSVYVEDTTNGYPLYEFNSDVVSDFPGSIIKLMTLLLAWEHHSGDWTSGTVTVSAADVTDPFSGGSSSAGFAAGDVVTWEGLAYGLLLPSGFDACQAIARTIGDALGAPGGMTRFVTEMNARGALIGMTNTTFTDPIGGSKTYGPTVVRNQTTARDMVKLAKVVYSHSELRAIGGTVSHGVPVTGGRTTTLTMTNFSRFINGPTVGQSGVSDANVRISKNGEWVPPLSGEQYESMVTLWIAPSGNEVILATIGSRSLIAAMFDQRGLMFSIPRDFSYLAGAAPGSDPLFASVQLLIGADGSLADESAAARTITNNGTTIGAAVISLSTGSVLFDSAADYLTVPDAASISVGSGDMTIETWFAGPGVEPGGEAVLFCKWNSAANQREWLIERTGAGGINLFASSNGTGAATVAVLTSGDGIGATFWNGAPRHIALVKNSNVLAVYIDGERMANTITAAALFDGSGPLTIGYAFSSVSATGSFDEFRAEFGTARYTADMVTLNAQKFPRS